MSAGAVTITSWRYHTVLPLGDKPIFYRYTVKLSNGTTRTVDVTCEEQSDLITTWLMDKLGELHERK